MNHHKPKDIPLNPNAPFMKIQIHTIKFNGITPTVWATLTQLSNTGQLKTSSLMHSALSQPKSTFHIICHNKSLNNSPRNTRLSSEIQ